MGCTVSMSKVSIQIRRRGGVRWYVKATDALRPAATRMGSLPSVETLVAPSSLAPVSSSMTSLERALDSLEVSVVMLAVDLTRTCGLEKTRKKGHEWGLTRVGQVGLVAADDVSDVLRHGD